MELQKHSEELFKSIFFEAENFRNIDFANIANQQEALIHVCSLTLRLANCCMSTLLPPHTITSRGPRGAGRRPGKDTRHQRHSLFATAKIPLYLSFCLQGNMERSFSQRKLEIRGEKDKSSAFHFNLTSCFFASRPGDGGLTFILQSSYEAAVDGCQRCSTRHLHQHTLVICRATHIKAHSL